MAAVPRAARVLPPTGQTANLALSGPTTLTLNGPDLTAAPTQVHWTGSRMVEVLTGGVDFVRLQVLRFTAEAIHPQLGKITLTLPDIDMTHSSVLRQEPGGLIEAWLMSFDATFENGTRLTTLEPAKWTAPHPAFPPPPLQTAPDGTATGGSLYTLASPIRLGTINSNGSKTHLGSLDAFNHFQGSLLG